MTPINNSSSAAFGVRLGLCHAPPARPRKMLGILSRCTRAAAITCGLATGHWDVGIGSWAAYVVTFAQQPLLPQLAADLPHWRKSADSGQELTSLLYVPRQRLKFGPERMRPALRPVWQSTPSGLSQDDDGLLRIAVEAQIIGATANTPPASAAPSTRMPVFAIVFLLADLRSSVRPFSKEDRVGRKGSR
jgi:hypothetical protein